MIDFGSLLLGYFGGIISMLVVLAALAAKTVRKTRAEILGGES